MFEETLSAYDCTSCWLLPAEYQAQISLSFSMIKIVVHMFFPVNNQEIKHDLENVLRETMTSRE